jgi:hypothetical protein
MSLFIKPLAVALLRFAIPFYKAFREFLTSDASKEAITQIQTGAQQIGEGLFTLDFNKLKEGLSNLFGGIKDLIVSWFDISGTSISEFWEKFKTFASDAWNWFKSILTTGWDLISKPLTDAFKWAWNTFWDFLGGLGNEDWANSVSSFEKGLESLWDTFSGYLEEFDWSGPLAPFLAALKTGWDEIVGPMVDSLIKALNEKIPGFKEAVEWLFSPQDEEQGLFGGLVSIVSTLTNVIFPGLGTAMQVLYDTILEKIGTKDDTGESIIGGFNNTTNAVNTSTASTNILIEALNNIPKNISTTHTITTVYRTVRA